MVNIYGCFRFINVVNVDILICLYYLHMPHALWYLTRLLNIVTLKFIVRIVINKKNVVNILFVYLFMNVLYSRSSVVLMPTRCTVDLRSIPISEPVLLKMFWFYELY